MYVMYVMYVTYVMYVWCMYVCNICMYVCMYLYIERERGGWEGERDAHKHAHTCINHNVHIYACMYINRERIGYIYFYKIFND